MLLTGLTSDLGDAYRCFWDTMPHTAHAGGLVFIMKPSFARQFTSVASVGVGRGNITPLVCTGPHGTLHVHNSSLDHPIGPSPPMLGALGLATWACSPPVWRRHELHHGRRRHDRAIEAAGRGNLSGSHADTFLRMFGHWVEVFRPTMAHRGRADGT